MLPSPWNWILLAVTIAAIVIGIGSIFYRLWVHLYVPWLDLPGYYAGTKYFSRLPTNVPLLTEAVQKAESLLIEHTKWNAANLALVGHSVRIFVTDTESWLDAFGQRVAGQQVNNTLVVGPSFAALCHEFAHLAELIIDNRTEYDHADWETNGIAAANRAFADWLAKRRAVSVASLEAVECSRFLANAANKSQA